MAAASGSAHAQPASDQADALFRQGKELLAAGKVAEACAAFDHSQQLDPTTPTLMNQANCRERNGQLATARNLFVEAAQTTSAATTKASRQMHATATERAARLAERLSTLRIDVPESGRVAGLEILRNGEVVDAARWNQVVPIDGGTYRISARAPGRVAWSTEVAVAVEREAKVIAIPELGATKPEPAVVEPTGDPPAAPAAAPAAPAEPARGERPTSWSARRKLAVGFAAGGVLALSAGSALGVVATRRENDAYALCPALRAECDDAARANQLVRSGHRLAIAANVMFAAAAGTAITAGFLWFTGSPEPDRRVAVLPLASPGHIVVTARGAF